MGHGLDCKLSDGRCVADLLFAPLRERAIEPTLIDVGARNGMHQTVIPSCYAKESTIIGFEPNQDEYQKLVTQTTDAEVIGAPMSRFKQEKYFNCALWNAEERRPFYITAGVGACTLMGKADPRICQNMWLEGDSRSYMDIHAEVRRTAPVECKRLDSVLLATEIVDILKIDVEGGELAVLQGATKLLDNHNILFVKSEFLLTPYFENGPLLGHQQVFLHEHGFRLLDLDFDHLPYTRAKTAIPASVDRRLIYGGDAYFMLDPERNKMDSTRAHRMGIACLVFHFSSLGVSLLRDAGLLPEADIAAVEKAIAKNWTSKRMKHVWAKLPGKVKDIVR
jgi:FkbM family methyltransferase